MTFNDEKIDTVSSLKAIGTTCIKSQILEDFLLDQFLPIHLKMDAEFWLCHGKQKYNVMEHFFPITIFYIDYFVTDGS